MKRQFSKDGHVTTATSPQQAVRLAYDGWHEVPVTPDPEPAAPVAEEPEQPTPEPRKRTSNRS